jgi:hypothetical protein
MQKGERRIAAAKSFHLNLYVRAFFNDNKSFILLSHGSTLPFLVENYFGLTVQVMLD